MNGENPFGSTSTASTRFDTTHWSVVLMAGQSASPQSRAALEKLCRTYWHPLYAFVRRKGYPEADAQDLTQQFFARLLARNDFENVSPKKGKFRTFLLTALSHFLSNEYDRSRAAKRGGGQVLLSLDELKSAQSTGIEPADNLSPDKLFDLRWAMTVLEHALLKLRQEMSECGKGAQFDALKQYLTDEAGPGDYAAVAAALNTNTQAIAVAVHRLRQRYCELVRLEVAETVSSPLELEEEMRHLYAVLNQ